MGAFDKNSVNQFIVFQGKLLGKLRLSFGKGVHLQDSLLRLKVGDRDFLVLKGRPRDHAQACALRSFLEVTLGRFLIDGPGQIRSGKQLRIRPEDHERQDCKRWLGNRLIYYGGCISLAPRTKDDIARAC